MSGYTTGYVYHLLSPSLIACITNWLQQRRSATSGSVQPFHSLTSNIVCFVFVLSQCPHVFILLRLVYYPSHPHLCFNLVTKPPFIHHSTHLFIYLSSSIPNPSPHSLHILFHLTPSNTTNLACNPPPPGPSLWPA